MSTVQPSPDLLFSHHMSEARGLRRAIRNRRQFVDYFEAKGMQQHAQAARHDVLKLRASLFDQLSQARDALATPKTTRRKTVMKTLTTVVTAFALAAALTACDQNKTAAPAAATEVNVVCQQYTQLKPLGAAKETASSPPASVCVALR